ncbi:MAG: universal stress protein [Myxococcota bacterium]
MKFDTIAVATDFSEPACQALSQAEALARTCGAELVLVHASGVDPKGAYLYELASRIDEPWQAYLDSTLTHAREQLRDLEARVAARGHRTRAVFAPGFADQAIVDAVRDVGADLLVVGTHGYTGVQRWMLGSVAERVARLAPCHVLVVRGAPASFRRVLVGTDFSSASASALDAALALADVSGRIDVVHGYHPPPGASGSVPPWVEQSLREGARAAAEALLSTRPRQRIHLDVAVGAPGPLLQEHLRAERHEAVFIGSHGKRGLRRMILGSVTEHTLRAAPCSVFVARA